MVGLAQTLTTAGALVQFAEVLTSASIRDLDLMIDNAILFNGAQSEVGQVAVLVRDKYQDLLAPVKAPGNVKRKGSEKTTQQPNKKARLS